MTADEARKLEETLAALVRHLRGEAEVRAATLERRIETLEKQIDFSQRLARLEKRAGLEEAHLIRPEHASWRNGSGR